LEGIHAEEWFRGNREEAYSILEEAAEFFSQSRDQFLYALDNCQKFSGWFPTDRREELTPSIVTFQQMTDLLEEIVNKLRARELPTLHQVHTANHLMRTEMIVGERKALANRGTTGHFPLGAS